MGDLETEKEKKKKKKNGIIFCGVVVCVVYLREFLLFHIVFE